MDALTVHLIAAARPNFMKVAPLYHALDARPWCTPRLVHTGQHYDDNMSASFIDELGLPEPHHHLGIGSGTHAEQTGGVMIAYERLCAAHRPGLTVVVGDVNSTAACALAAAKLLIPVAHLEAGLRSFDRTMPEEINRIVTDAIADMLWTPSADADDNLAAEGIPAGRITRVGNIMIDSLILMRPRIEAAAAREEFGFDKRGFGMVTLHRPSNVDDAATLGILVETLVTLAGRLPLVFAVHPRTRARLEEFGLLQRLDGAPGMHLAEPMGYIRFMALVCDCRLVITDSGGIQEETTYLGIPCLTLRDTTERPVTVSAGSNRLVTPGDLADHVARAMAGDWPTGRRPDLWDGKTASRIVADMEKRFGG